MAQASRARGDPNGRAARSVRANGPRKRVQTADAEFWSWPTGLDAILQAG